MRGNPVGTLHRAVSKRSIPAYAGEPRNGLRLAETQWVYPRVCGGTSFTPVIRAKCWGLSPRMRGNHGNDRADGGLRRSIPAYAGEPEQDNRQRAAARVYPRVCGGTSQSPCIAAAHCGLSPRMRGNPAQALPDESAMWSIPAYAGEPITLAGSLNHRAVYPRVCGGTSQSPCIAAAHCGLSPRMRGNPAQALPDESAMWSIPAYAGEPITLAGSLNHRAVYPRVCGGTRMMGQRRERVPGLSPRMRGNPQLEAGSRRMAGSIPAYAGEPTSTHQ